MTFAICNPIPVPASPALVACLLHCNATNMSNMSPLSLPWPPVNLSARSRRRRRLSRLPQAWSGYFRPLSFRDGFSILLCLLRPRSRGRGSLRSGSPFDRPRIVTNALQEPHDVRTLVEGCRSLQTPG